jgi:tetratricopeptide (TPR) repeat protein
VASETYGPIETGALTNAGASASIDDIEANRRRRRLGNWQSSPLADLPDFERSNQSLADDILIPPTTSPLGQRRHAIEPTESRSDPQVIPAPSPMSAGVRSRLETLIVQIQANPHDVAALTELARELQARGMATEARDIQDRLAAMQENVSHAKASERIIPISQTAPGTQSLTETGRMRRQATETLRKSGVLAATLTSFPLQELGFTIPLPGESDLPAEARELIAQSGEELAAGQLMAAFDSCLTAIDRVPDYTPIHLRIAEIQARQHSARRASAHAQAIVRLSEVTGKSDDLWMARRILLHASESDHDALKSLVDSLIDANRPVEAARYGAKLIERDVEFGLVDDALTVSNRLCAFCPGDAQVALGNVELLVKKGAIDVATERWERAVAAGADSLVAASSMAALIVGRHEFDHSRVLGEVTRALRPSRNDAIVQAYERTADALSRTPIHAAGRAILLVANDDPSAETALLAAMTDPAASDAARALTAVAVARKIENPARLDALKIAIHALQSPLQIDDSVWIALVGAAPTVADLEADLGETLLERGDPKEAIQALKQARVHHPHDEVICRLLAKAHVQVGQLGAGLAVLDELAIALRKAGKLEEMASVLRTMSSLAPNNIKVKTRLIDAYLQRGFVEEARSELLARADLEERAGQARDAAVSLQRSADLSWGLGKDEESFAAYHRLIALAPDDAGHRSSLVNLYLQKGRISEAAEHQRAVVDISIRSGSKHEAIAALHQVIGLTPDDATAYYQLGDLLTAMGEHHQAEKVFKRLSLMNPSDAVARQKAAEMALLKPADDRLAKAPAS